MLNTSSSGTPNTVAMAMAVVIVGECSPASIQKARLAGRYGDFIDGQARGAVGSIGALGCARNVILVLQ